MNAKLKEGGYTTWLLYAFGVVIAWGSVPLMAKLANLPPYFTAAIVNWVATVAVLLIIIKNRRLGDFKKLSYYLRAIGLAIVWPLIYSLAYFSTLTNASPTLATITGYTWPVFAIILLALFFRKPITKGAVIAIVLETIAMVAFYLMTAEGQATLRNDPSATLNVWLLVGIGAGALQAVFNVVTAHEDKNGENDWFPGEYVWFWTFVGALITAIGATVASVQQEAVSLSTVTLTQLWPLVVLGVLGNAFGFAWFLVGNQRARRANQVDWFWLIMATTPILQVALIWMFGYDKPNLVQGICIFFVAAIFYAYKRSEVADKRMNAQIAAGD